MDPGSAAHDAARVARCAAFGERRWSFAATAPPRPGHHVPDAVQRFFRAAPQSRDPYFRVDMPPDQQRTTAQRAPRCAASGERRWSFAATAPTRPGHHVPDAVQRFFALLRRVGTHTFAPTWTPDQQRTTAQRAPRCAASGEPAGAMPTPPSCSACARRDHRPRRDPPMSRCRRGCPARPRRSCAGCGA